MITDNRMGDRVEVILVITGLGATPVQSPFVARKQAEPIPVEVETVLEAQPTIAERAPVEIIHQRSDLDLPAFMRRRMR